MKKFTVILSTLLAVAMISSCSNDAGERGGKNPPEGKTYMGISIKLPGHTDTRLDPQGTIAGATKIETLDLYLLSADGNTLLYSNRYANDGSQLQFGSSSTGNDIIFLGQPFSTAPGDKRMIVIINSPNPLFPGVPSRNYLFQLSASLPMSSIAAISTETVNVGGVGDVLADKLVLSGQSDSTFTIADGVSSDDVKTNGTNVVAVDVIRVPSRVIVTTGVADGADVVNSNNETLGTISDITWSVAQGGNSVYLFNQPVSGSDPGTSSSPNVRTPGYDYVPNATNTTDPSTYFDYSDLANTTDAVPALPDAAHLMYLPGKFLLENTHLSGDASNSNYKQGNTAYVLVRATFTPDPSQIADGNALTGGTFYVGDTNGKIYSSIDEAQAYNPGQGIQGQKVHTYTGGKVLYYLWLNPDVVAKPVNSPVVRNSIYHINILSFKSLGTNWNPLAPDGSNPDPLPGGDDESPANPMDPNAPLSSTDTYMSVQTTVLPWTTYSYGIDL